MRKIIYALLTLLVIVSCGKSKEQKIEDTLKDVVVEKAGGISVDDYKTLSVEIDSVRVSDIKAFEDKCFPLKDYPNGVPSDFNDEHFTKFIAPLRTHKVDNDIVYLSVKHKYIIFNPLLNKKVEVEQYRLLDPNTLEYIEDDLRKDKTWTGVQEYEMSKMSF